MTDLSGKTAFVTGAASGIGRAIAERLGRDGATVIVTDIDTAGAVAVAGGITGAEAHALDVTDDARFDALIDDVAAHLGLDIMVNTAGCIAVAPVVDTELAAWQRQMAVNLDAVFIGARAAARVMSAQIARGRPPGLIVNMASGAGRRGVPMLAGYCAAKAAVISLTQTLAQELGPQGIRVNALAPGHIETPFWEEIAAGFAAHTGETAGAVIERFRAGVPMGRFGTAEEVAAAVAWLASSDASYVSGQVIAMNGAELPW
ncbi:MAG: SDR family oxidoreductase [Pseudomonadota bacterium]